VSVGAHPVPVPPMHFERTVKAAPVPFRILPVATALTGFRIELFVRSVISKVLSDDEELITTASRRGWGIVPVALISGGAKGQAVLPSFATQTFPTSAE
jgi:hypothetical protein